jgi:GNAT superfamily N-acetyltransferase
VVDAGPARDDDGPVLDDGLPATGEVRSLYLDPTVQGGGLGRALLDAAVADLVGRGAPDVVLWVVEGNAGARRFYEREGWRADGARRTRDVADHPVGEVRYRLRGA